MNAGLTLLRGRARRGGPRRPRRTSAGPARHLLLAFVLVSALVVAPGAKGTPPDITVTISGTLGLNGWYRSNVTVGWQVEGETSSSGCDTRTLTTDTPGTKLTCSADFNGDSTVKSVTIKLDKTAPIVLGAAERLPNASGWYTAPVTVSFSGTDATSGIASCTSTRYSGPDNPAAAVAGSCADGAGNMTTASVPFKYDATPPSLSVVTRKLGNRSVELTWRPSADTRVVEIVRLPGRNGEAQSIVYRGPATSYRDAGLAVGRKYQYRVTALDEAENRFERTVDITATGALLSPVPAAQVTAPPHLVWTTVKGASYYNLQLVRGRKVLSVWPVRARFQLQRSWRYQGRRYRLQPGVYRWYVWPGYGRISAARYGRLLGGSMFVVSG